MEKSSLVEFWNIFKKGFIFNSKQGLHIETLFLNEAFCETQAERNDEVYMSRN